MGKCHDVAVLELDKAIINLGTLNSGDEFIVKDLFTDEEWESFKVPLIKSSLGKLFRNAVLDKTIDVIAIGETKRHQYKYKKR